MSVRAFQEKKRNLMDLYAQAADEDELASLKERIDAIDSVLDKELEELKEVKGEHDDLKGEIETLHEGFEKAEYEREHGAGTYVEGDVEDIYAVRKAKPITQERFATLDKKKLEAMKKEWAASDESKGTLAYSDTMKKRAPKKK